MQGLDGKVTLFSIELSLNINEITSNTIVLLIIEAPMAYGYCLRQTAAPVASRRL